MKNRKWELCFEGLTASVLDLSSNKMVLEFQAITHGGWVACIDGHPYRELNDRRDVENYCAKYADRAGAILTIL